MHTLVRTSSSKRNIHRRSSLPPGEEREAIGHRSNRTFNPLSTFSLQAGLGNRVTQRLLQRQRTPEQEQAPSSQTGAAPETAAETAAENVEPQARVAAQQELFEHGRRLFGAGNFEEAIEAFEQIRQDRPEGDPVRRDITYNIGMCNLRLRRFAAAILYFETYQRSPGADREVVLERLAEAQRGLGTFDFNNPANEARETGAIAIPSSEDDTARARQLFERGRAAYRGQDFVAAALNFEHIRKIASLSEDVKRDITYNLGMCNLMLRRYPAAALYFETYRSFGGADTDLADNRLAECARGAGQAPRAEQETISAR